jgi:hypothetical protein
LRADSKNLTPPSALSYGIAYLWWAVMIAASTLVAFLARDLYQMAMVLTSWHRYTVHFVNQALTLAILLSLLAAVILLEAYFRHGVEKGNLAGRVWRAASGIFIALAVIEGLRLLIEISAGAVNLVSVLYFVLAVLGGWGSRRQTQRLAGKPVTPIVFADAGKLTRTGWLGDRPAAWRRCAAALSADQVPAQPLRRGTGAGQRAARPAR